MYSTAHGVPEGLGFQSFDSQRLSRGYIYCSDARLVRVTPAAVNS